MQIILTQISSNPRTSARMTTMRQFKICQSSSKWGPTEKSTNKWRLYQGKCKWIDKLSFIGSVGIKPFKERASQDLAYNSLDLVDAYVLNGRYYVLFENTHLVHANIFFLISYHLHFGSGFRRMSWPDEVGSQLRSHAEGNSSFEGGWWLVFLEADYNTCCHFISFKQFER